MNRKPPNSLSDIAHAARQLARAAANLEKTRKQAAAAAAAEPASLLGSSPVKARQTSVFCLLPDHRDHPLEMPLHRGAGMVLNDTFFQTTVTPENIIVEGTRLPIPVLLGMLQRTEAAGNTIGDVNRSLMLLHGAIEEDGRLAENRFRTLLAKHTLCEALQGSDVHWIADHPECCKWVREFTVDELTPAEQDDFLRCLHGDCTGCPKRGNRYPSG